MNKTDLRDDIVKTVYSATAERWPEDEWIDVSDDVILNIYIDMDGKRKATAFQKSDKNLEYGVDIAYVGDR